MVGIVKSGTDIISSNNVWHAEMLHFTDVHLQDWGVLLPTHPSDHSGQVLHLLLLEKGQLIVVCACVCMHACIWMYMLMCYCEWIGVRMLIVCVRACVHACMCACACNRSEKLFYK